MAMLNNQRVYHMCTYWGPKHDCYVPTHGRPVEAPHQSTRDTPVLRHSAVDLEPKSVDLPKGTMEKSTFFYEKNMGKKDGNVKITEEWRFE